MQWNSKINLAARIRKLESEMHDQIVRPADGEAIQLVFFAIPDEAIERAQVASTRVVVAVGTNYTQGANKVPVPWECRDDIGLNRRYVVHALGKLDIPTLEVMKEPTDGGPLVSWDFQPAMLREPFHFVMTNFSPWITEHAWSTLSKEKRKPLLDHKFRRGSNCAFSRYHHLLELQRQLAEYDVIWVGHGRRNGGWKLFREFRDCNTSIIKTWALTANLSRPFQPEPRKGGQGIVFKVAKMTA